jgi:hypothetical protein
MAKAIAKLSKEYLENKLKELEEQKIKIEDRIEQYSQLWQKVSGAIEVTTEMLGEFTEKEPIEAKNE